MMAPSTGLSSAGCDSDNSARSGCNGWFLLLPTAILSAMIHIGIDSRLTFYRTGGTATYIRELIQALEVLDKENTYTVFRSRKQGAQAIGRFHHVALWTPSHHCWERTALSLELLRHRLDVWHSPDFIPPWRGARHHVITVHDLTFLHYPQYLTDDSRRYYNDQIQWAVDHADHILTVSESARDDMIQMLNVLRQKITVQPNGVDHQHFRPMDKQQAQARLKHYGVAQDYFLFVGTIEPRKNLDGLLKAYSALHGLRNDAPELLIVGKPGWLADELLERIKAAPQVHWLNHVSDDDLPAFYNGAKALILPSFYEGFGLPALEAMACGTVPIVSNRSSLPEVVGDVGLQVNPDEPDSITQAMQHILDAEHVWLTTQRSAAVDRAKAFTWERSARIARDVYQQVVKP
jgi:glycosyltransferase involved in cell wall biosynthesis